MGFVPLLKTSVCALVEQARVACPAEHQEAAVHLGCAGRLYNGRSDTGDTGPSDAKV